jgi:hypothetical protein
MVCYSNIFLHEFRIKIVNIFRMFFPRKYLNNHYIDPCVLVIRWENDDSDAFYVLVDTYLLWLHKYYHYIIPKYENP